jgi:hypothetical protein
MLHTAPSATAVSSSAARVGLSSAANLVKAAVQNGIDTAADAGPQLSAALDPADAVAEWIHRFTALLRTKRGLAPALHPGDAAFSDLPDYALRNSTPPSRHGSALLTSAHGPLLSLDVLADHDRRDATAGARKVGAGPEHGPWPLILDRRDTGS